MKIHAQVVAHAWKNARGKRSRLSSTWDWETVLRSISPSPRQYLASRLSTRKIALTCKKANAVLVRNSAKLGRSISSRRKSLLIWKLGRLSWQRDSRILKPAELNNMAMENWI